MTGYLPHEIRIAPAGGFLGETKAVRTVVYGSSAATYECVDCLHRQRTDTTPGSCPECGGRVRNVAVPRE